MRFAFEGGSIADSSSRVGSGPTSSKKPRLCACSGGLGELVLSNAKSDTRSNADSDLLGISSAALPLRPEVWSIVEGSTRGRFSAGGGSTVKSLMTRGAL